MSSWQQIIQNARPIEVRHARDVRGTSAGRWRSRDKGEGLDFDEVRPYMPGDQVRFIDWNVTARSGQPHVKRFREERDHRLVVLADVSASNAFGSGEQKARAASRVVASLIASGIKARDRVGLVAVSDRVEASYQAKSGRAHALHLVKALAELQPAGRDTELDVGLNYVLDTYRRRTSVFVVSDLAMTPAAEARFLDRLRVLAHRHEVTVCELRDPRDEVLPNVGSLTVACAETGEVVDLDTSRKSVRDAYALAAQNQHKKITDALAEAGVRHVVLPLEQDILHHAERVLRRPGRRIRR